MKELASIYRDLSNILERIGALAADVGCLHSNAYELTTMGGPEKRRFFCPDCGEDIEEDFHELG